MGEVRSKGIDHWQSCGRYAGNSRVLVGCLPGQAACLIQYPDVCGYSVGSRNLFMSNTELRIT